jgi:hypothetical protein
MAPGRDRCDMVDSRSVSISNVRSIELGKDGLYLVRYYGTPEPEPTKEHGVVDSIYNDGPHKTTFTVTFNIS